MKAKLLCRRKRAFLVLLVDEALDSIDLNKMKNYIYNAYLENFLQI